MKIGGKVVEQPPIIEVLIPRANDQMVVFKCQPIMDYTPFENLCPMPKPPIISFPSGETRIDVEDEDYKKKVLEWLKAKTHWIFITSLRATPDLEWDKVDYGKPETWALSYEELRAVFLDPEINEIVKGVQEANALNDEKIVAARNSFLASREKVSPKQ